MNKNRFMALMGVSLASFLTAIDFAIVNTALPSIQQQLGASLAGLQWVMNIYVLFICATMVTMGRFGDLFGRKKMLLVGTIIFAVASLVAGLSHNLALLIISRALQGVGSATIIPCSLSLITDIFPQKERGRAIGIWSGINGVGFAVGPVLGGVLVDTLSWPWVFFIVIPFAVISLILCMHFIKTKPQADARTPVDWWGFSLLSSGISSLVVAVIQGPVWGWGSGAVIACFGLSILCLAALCVAEIKVKHPLMDFKLFANKQFFVGSIANFSVVTFAYPGFFLIPLYLQSICHQSAFRIGMLLLPITLAMTILSPITPKLVKQIGNAKTLLLGLILLVISVFMQCFLGEVYALPLMLTSFILFGVAWGIVFGAATNFAISSLPEKAAGVASGALWTLQNIGGAIGLAISGTIFRVIEKHSFFQQHGLHLNASQHQLVNEFLQNPEKLQQIPMQQVFAEQATKVVDVFHHAFVLGFHDAMAFLGVVSLAALMAARCLLSKRVRSPR